MEVKSTEWRPGPTVCRCCLSEGCYKDISTEYFWMGKREVYAEMLSETFDVTIGFSKSGGPNSNSRLICEPCISRLRDASEFKRQVLECEKTFMQHLDPGTSTSADLDITVDMDKEVKLERVKTEKRLSDDDFDDRVGFDDDDDDDDLDDEPLTKLASKVPKKESVDLLDLLDNAKVAEKRKSTAKTKSTPAKKSKKETIQPTPSKSVKIEKKKKEIRPVSRRTKAKRNAAVLLKYSTMYPFRMQSKFMRCVFCRFTSEAPTEYRRHLDTDHRTFLVRAAVCHITTENEYLKVDVTALKCRTCLEPFECLDDIAVHIRDVHDVKGLDLNYELGCMPFKMDGEKWTCYVCKKKMPNLVTLNRHTTSHFCDYVCDICGKCYLSDGSLKCHRKTHQIAEHACRSCWRAFNTKEERKEHVRTTPSCWPIICVKCRERFQSWERKQKHMIEKHGIPKRTYQCSECAERFDVRKAFYQHYKFNHSDDALFCRPVS